MNKRKSSIGFVLWPACTILAMAVAGNLHTASAEARNGEIEWVMARQEPPAHEPPRGLSGRTAKNWHPPKSVRQIIIAAAERKGFPVNYALAVAQQESGLRPSMTGDAGEIGLFQIKCGYVGGKPLQAQVIGYRGVCSKLYDPALNAEWGIKNLMVCLEKAGGSWAKGIDCHNKGLDAKLNPKSAYAQAVLSKL